MKSNKQRLGMIILAVLLFFALTYIAVNKWNNIKQQKQIEIYQQGAQYGYEQAIIQIVQQATSCQQVPLMVGNQTMNIIAVECLQQAQE